MTTLATSTRITRPVSISSFEFWPSWLFYIPIVVFWVLMGLRHRSFSLPTAANPRIETGGLCGERKTTILDQAGVEAIGWIAPYVVVTTDVDDQARTLQAMADASLSLPVVVKPNIGCNGTGVRLVTSEATLETTLAEFPRNVELVVQELVVHDGEAGIFYIREPGAPTGRITSLTLKEAPVIIGDGRSTIRSLILEDERFQHVPQLYLPRLKDRHDEVLKQGERLRLVFAGNHCKGSIFMDGSHDITRALSTRIDSIMQDFPDFHFGRLDVRFESSAALRIGESFRIIEINGVGSEATHIWDPHTSLWTAYLDQFEHYRIAFEIGAQMRQRGIKPTPLRELLASWRLQRRLMAGYPLND